VVYLTYKELISNYKQIAECGRAILEQAGKLEPEKYKEKILPVYKEISGSIGNINALLGEGANPAQKTLAGLTVINANAPQRTHMTSSLKCTSNETTELKVVRSELEDIAKHMANFDKEKGLTLDNI
jgi:hypothetical protein